MSTDHTVESTVLYHMRAERAISMHLSFVLCSVASMTVLYGLHYHIEGCVSNTV